MDNQKSVLIISYVFPPYPGIGGRRWAKFSKYLQRSGWKVHVLHCHSPFSENSKWNKDVEMLNGSTYEFESGYPSSLLIQPVTIAEKIFYRLSLLKVKTGIRGNYYDRSGFLHKKLPALVKEIIAKHQIKNVIVSAPPFHYLYFLTDLKNHFPDLNLIGDFRDPWVNNETSFGFTTLSSDRIEYEKTAQSSVMITYDKIISVSGVINDYFRSLGVTSPDKFMVVENGIDPEEIVDSNESHERASGKLEFVLAGSLYQATRKLFFNFVDSISEIKDSKPEIYNDLVFNFYGSSPADFIAYVNEKAVENIRFHKEVSLDEIKRVVADSTIGMLFLTDDLTYSFSTKFYEYISLKKPVAVFSKGGFTGEYVKENEIGFNITINNMAGDIQIVWKKWKNGKLFFNPSYRVERHYIPNLVPLIENILVR